MLVKEYNQGDISESGEQYYIVVKYKGKFICGAIYYLTRLKDYDITENCDVANSLSELYEICKNDSDRLTTTVRSNQRKRLKYFNPGEITCDNSLNNLILWQKPKGKKVWVFMKELKSHDLDELLHIKYNYQNKSVEKFPNKELPVRDLITVVE